MCFSINTYGNTQQHLFGSPVINYIPDAFCRIYMLPIMLLPIGWRKSFRVTVHHMHLCYFLEIARWYHIKSGIIYALWLVYFALNQAGSMMSLAEASYVA
ncbi:hypothetical protein A359_05580 [secondary endosymbiont of Ctenarytaina eucalypti]|uniref:Uncharacterized protein n=1 Tax=secondary endosymbiont of Ctenarytaina eucalypti TaxID=1199245 RepID=J3TXL4_9ENTR|nr:hypothetical protein A359_05580 [secondary endosymbiont of Ctenarytaina eucalypti]